MNLLFAYSVFVSFVFAIVLLLFKNSELRMWVTIWKGEVQRLKAGKFTEEEFQNLCHNLDSDCPFRFGRGCIEYNKKMFGDKSRLQMKEHITYAELCADQDLEDDRIRKQWEDDFQSGKITVDQYRAIYGLPPLKKDGEV